MSRVLRIASCMADNAMPFARGVATYLGARLELDVEFVDDLPWQEHEQALYRGEIDLCWICGLSYARGRDTHRGSLEPLAAAVPAGERYGGAAVYFSDVIVPSASTAKTLEDLRGARWAFNEPNSHSGYNILIARCANAGWDLDDLRGLAAAGSHQAALECVVAGKADAAAMDSTVLETELELRPWLREWVRTVESLGPSPAPPWVCPGKLAESLRAAIAGALERMHLDQSGRQLLAAAGLQRLAAVGDDDYEPIRALDSQVKRYASSAERARIGEWLTAGPGSGCTAR